MIRRSSLWYQADVREIWVYEPGCPTVVLVCTPGQQRKPLALPLCPQLRAKVWSVLVATGRRVARVYVEMPTKPKRKHVS